MPTEKNKLPTFGSTANVDDAIVQNTSALKDTGFQANTLIESAQVNTYFKMFVNALNGLVNATFNSVAEQSNIYANSTVDEWTNYISKGLSKIIYNTRVASSTHATSAHKLDNAQTVELTGDVSGSSTFDGQSGMTITVDVKTSAALDSKNIGDSTHPVYFGADGKPVKIATVERAQKLPSVAVGSAVHPVYVNSNGEVKPITLSNATYATGKYIDEGLFRVSAISDKTSFLAYVEVVGSGVWYASGIARFANGYIDGCISGVHIYNIASSNATMPSQYVVNVVSNESLHTTDIKIQILYGDGHTRGMYDTSSGIIMYITKLYS